ncbi:hypothetical protein LX32DRAFT_129180 [Colletotrichum zoysiae]|uniref:Uncharacterized protein n=1 Tax=Colletotrichum zoysiae TaxID=1216348 RepID=A0AAD9HRN5_9PEZI|nr:hypothetical protein LX32DRAFT_129180 [Colletotrichum zoysiae]
MDTLPTPSPIQSRVPSYRFWSKQATWYVMFPSARFVWPRAHICGLGVHGSHPPPGLSAPQGSQLEGVPSMARLVRVMCIHSYPSPPHAPVTIFVVAAAPVRCRWMEAGVGSSFRLSVCRIGFRFVPPPPPPPPPPPRLLALHSREFIIVDTTITPTITITTTSTVPTIYRLKIPSCTRSAWCHAHVRTHPINTSYTPSLFSCRLTTDPDSLPQTTYYYYYYYYYYYHYYHIRTHTHARARTPTSLRYAALL